MARQRPPDRLDQLVESAVQVFTERGYRRAQMADVARAMGVAPGTLYLYVKSKEALFDLLVQRGFRDDPGLPPPHLPLPTPAPGAMLQHLRQRVARERKLPVLTAALRCRRPRDPRAELEDVVRELYAMMVRNRRGLKLLERSALDWPELAALYFQRVRGGLIADVTEYLDRRISQKLLRRVPDTAAAARLVIETAGWFAVHRYSDQEPMHIDEQTAEDTVADILVHAFAKE